MQKKGESSNYYFFKVANRPIGPAPDHIKDAWKKTVLVGKKGTSEEYNVVTKEVYPPREHFVAEITPSLLALIVCQENPALAQEAVRWYIKEAIPRGQTKFCFGTEEVEHVSEISEDSYTTFLDWLYTLL